eukprot:231602-Prymnesium_polylepis.3
MSAISAGRRDAISTVLWQQGTCRPTISRIATQTYGAWYTCVHGTGAPTGGAKWTVRVDWPHGRLTLKSQAQGGPCHGHTG